MSTTASKKSSKVSSKVAVKQSSAASEIEAPLISIFNDVQRSKASHNRCLRTMVHTLLKPTIAPSFCKKLSHQAMKHLKEIVLKTGKFVWKKSSFCSEEHRSNAQQSWFCYLASAVSFMKPTAVLLFQVLVVFKREPNVERVVDFIARFLADGSDEDVENSQKNFNKNALSRSEFSIAVIR